MNIFLNINIFNKYFKRAQKRQLKIQTTHLNKEKNVINK